MDSLITHVIAWPTVLASLLMFGFAPGAVLRVVVLAYRRDDPRRTELLAELPYVPRVEKPFWVCEQLENALFEGFAGRLAALIGRMRHGRGSRPLPGSQSGADAMSHYLGSLLRQPLTIVDTSCLPLWQRAERLRGRGGHGNGYVNPAEADIIAAIVAAEERQGRDWAVAVPYAAQANLIRERLREELGPAGISRGLEVVVGTIDNFKGVEHDLVLVGCTRSNRSGSVGFLRTVGRLYVAMTRARGRLVVVGDMQTFTSARSPVRALMSAVMADVQRRGEVIPANEIAGGPR
jgi:AAA domain-containing protein